MRVRQTVLFLLFVLVTTNKAHSFLNSAPHGGHSSSSSLLVQPRSDIRSTTHHEGRRRRCQVVETALYSSGGGGGDDQTVSGTGTGTASIPNEIFNLVKSIVGAGVLSLPAGIAAYGNAPSAVIPAMLFIFLMGTISAYTFSLLARVCQATGAQTYAEAWSKTSCKGGNGCSWLIAASSAMDCFAGNVTYSMVLADTFRDLLVTLGFVTMTRTKALLGLTSTVLLPLCLVKNLSSLAPFSLVGIMGMAYTTVAIGIRYFGGAYALVPEGKFVADLAVPPSFGTVGGMGSAFSYPPKSLLLLCMLSTAYIAHFNAPKFYNELQNNTMRRFNIVTASSFGISMVVYAAVAVWSFLTFGGSTVGLVLNNYSTRDVLMSASRFAVALSLVFSYPLLFVGTRDGVMDLLRLRPLRVSSTTSTNSRFFENTVSVVLLTIITAIALKIKDLTFVASMSGAVFGTALIFIYPTIMFRNAMNDDDTTIMIGNGVWEKRLAGIIAILGVAIGGVGAKMALQTALTTTGLM